MTELKSAYELASSRIIAPKPRPEPEERSAIPEFVTDFEFPEEDEEDIRSAFIDNEEETLQESDPLDELDELDEREVKNEEVAVYEPEKITYDGSHIEVYWNGHFLDYGGFARLNRTMVFGLADRNVYVNPEIEPYASQVNQATHDQLLKLAEVEIADDAPKVFGATVPLSMNHAGRKIAYTMIESSDKIHKDYAERLNLFDEIWVATEYGKQIMQASDVHPKIHVMPLGVDIERYKPSVAKHSLGIQTRKFVFLSVFRWSYRKGFDILLRAFMEEFSNDDDVSLLLVSRPVTLLGEGGVNSMVDDFKGIRSGINKAEDDMPHVALYHKDIREKKMPDLYNSAHAFVLPSRGEGFGLPYVEAAASGLPVIATNCSGQSDFLTPENSFLVEPDGYVVAKKTGTMARMAKLCHFYEDQIFPNLGEKSLEQLRAQMRYVYDNYSEAKERAKLLRRKIINNYTWKKSVDRVYTRLLELSR